MVEYGGVTISGYDESVPYAYEVDGVRYDGLRYFFGGNAMTGNTPSRYIVYFDPNHPSDSVIHRRYSISHTAYFGFLIAALYGRYFVHKNYAKMPTKTLLDNDDK